MIAQTMVGRHLQGAAIGAGLADVAGAMNAVLEDAHRVAAATGLAEL